MSINPLIGIDTLTKKPCGLNELQGFLVSLGVYTGGKCLINSKHSINNFDLRSKSLLNTTTIDRNKLRSV